jgi:malate dehydrogenase (oxaloacetate-decarboxylating)(NADP+)
MGLPREHITVTDKSGVIYVGREAQMDPHKAAYARDTTQRTLADAISGADIFLGLSGPRVLTGAMVATMGPQPLILALANPTPEIMPEEALAARPDAIVATGRSDYPNQVNNVLCFPYMFRGALDVGASTITEAMKLACVEALAELTMQEPSEVVQAAYVGEQLRFGREYLIPKPFDPRLITTLAPAVARAAMESGVATRPIADLDAYRDQLSAGNSPAIDRQIERALTGQWGLGDQAFLTELAVCANRRVQPGLRGRPKKTASKAAQPS